MFIQKFHNVHFISKFAEIKLPQPNLILDPKANCPNATRFDCRYHEDGITVTLYCIYRYADDRTKPKRCSSADTGYYNFSMRVYDPTIEDVPDFDSTIYKYSGLDDEHAPNDTTVAIINPSVKTIKKCAFRFCSKMKKCVMHGGVETIENSAFAYCLSLHALFLPSSLKKIEYGAFRHCTKIRILPLPIDIDISQIGLSIIEGCRTFFQIPSMQQYNYRYLRTQSNDQAHQAVIDLHRNSPPLHRACLDINVSVQTIHDCIVTHGTQSSSITDHNGMTPLHILSLNPHADVGSISKCFDADSSAAFVGDSRGYKPLDYLRENNLDGHTWVVMCLCLLRDSMMR